MAVLLLFPQSLLPRIRKKQKQEEKSGFVQPISEKSSESNTSPLIFIPQLTDGCCGAIAVLHSILNNALFVVGSGRTNVALALFGIEPAEYGQIMLNGMPVDIKSPKQAIELGIAYVPEDRRQHGLILELSIAKNITLPKLDAYTGMGSVLELSIAKNITLPKLDVSAGMGLINERAEMLVAEQYRQQFSIRTPSVDLLAGKLSGGNQQKVVLSKWLNTNPRLLILDEPTRGIDVGAKEEVHRLISDLAQQGIAILMISSDLPEVLAMSDRIMVMREGRQMGIFSREEADQEVIMTAAMGRVKLDKGGVF